MKINIGENLKKLRIKSELTQEQLAEIFNVSPQAISRWENNSSYPDITMLPSLANYYNVSIDELIGMDEIRRFENLSDIFTEVHKFELDDKIDEAINMLRDAIKVYPNNHGLMSELALALTLKNNVKVESSFTKEAISLSERVLKDSTNSKLRGTTMANLCFLYLKANEAEKAKNLVKTLPHIWESREMLLPEIFQDNEYNNELKKSIITVLSLFCDKIQNIESRKYSEADKTIAIGINAKSYDDLREKLNLLTNFLSIDHE